MVKILDKNKDSIIVKLPASLESHIKVLSRGFEKITAAEKKQITTLRKSISMGDYVTHKDLYAKYFK